MALKIIKVKQLGACPVCKTGPQLERNSARRFRVHCPKCHCRTAWLSKTDAIVNWYNLAIMYWRSTDKLKTDEENGTD